MLHAHPAVPPLLEATCVTLPLHAYGLGATRPARTDARLPLTGETPVPPSGMAHHQSVRGTTPGSIRHSPSTGLSPYPGSLRLTCQRLLVPIIVVRILQLAATLAKLRLYVKQNSSDPGTFTAAINGPAPSPVDLMSGGRQRAVRRPSSRWRGGVVQRSEKHTCAVDEVLPTRPHQSSDEFRERGGSQSRFSSSDVVTAVYDRFVASGPNWIMRVAVTWSLTPRDDQPLAGNPFGP